METAAFLAQILGPIIIAVSLGLLVNQKSYLKMLADFEKSPALTYIGGISAMAIGLAVVLHHNVWLCDWPVVITIFGWGGIIKGIFLLIFPDKVYALSKAIKLDKILTPCAVIYLLLGAYLSYVGFFL